MKNITISKVKKTSEKLGKNILQRKRESPQDVKIF